MNEDVQHAFEEDRDVLYAVQKGMKKIIATYRPANWRRPISFSSSTAIKDQRITINR